MADLPAPFRVTDKRRETHDTWTLRLEPVEGPTVAPFAPGQFAMLYAFGAGEVPISVNRPATTACSSTRSARSER